MIIKLYFQTYARQHISCDDFFSEVTRKIDPSFSYEKTDIITIYVPILHEEVQEESKKGRMIVYLGQDQKPNLVAKQLVVSFPNIDGDYLEVKNHLIEEYGQFATKIECVDFQYLNDIR